MFKKKTMLGDNGSWITCIFAHLAKGDTDCSLFYTTF